MTFRVHGNLPGPIGANYQNQQWVANIRHVLDQAKKDVRTVSDTFVLMVFSKVIQRSPVDTGHFRSNWQFSFGSPDYSIRFPGGNTGEDFGNESTAERAMRTRIEAGNGTVGQVCWLANGVPYGPVLEYGGYPNPVQKGTYRKGSGWEIRSSGGYSKQAPQGMVRLTMMETDQILRDAARVIEG